MTFPTQSAKIVDVKISFYRKETKRMATPIIMPRQGQSVESCIITSWNKKVGDVVEKVYVKTTTRIRLREEPNTNCTTLDRINGGIKLEVLETLEGWYKVSYNGKIGYISADYANVVEE